MATWRDSQTGLTFQDYESWLADERAERNQIRDQDAFNLLMEDSAKFQEKYEVADDAMARLNKVKQDAAASNAQQPIQAAPNVAQQNPAASNAVQQNQAAPNVPQQNQAEAPKKVTVQSSGIESIVENYKKAFGNGKHPWYKEPETKDGKTVFMFPDTKTLIDFTTEQANQKKSFIIIDGATQKVMGYSNGDGKLRHANGQEFKEGDELKASEMNINDFQASLDKQRANSSSASQSPSLTSLADSASPNPTATANTTANTNTLSALPSTETNTNENYSGPEGQPRP
jgi:hypothetical protein